MSFEENKKDRDQIFSRIQGKVNATRQAFWGRWNSMKNEFSSSIEDFGEKIRIVESFEKEEKETIEKGIHDLKSIGGYQEVNYWEKQLNYLNSYEENNTGYYRKYINILLKGITKFKQYEQECATNYSRLEPRVREAENLAYSLDFKSARERINSIKQEIFNSRPMKREQKDVLVQRVFSALDKLNSRAKEEFEQRDGERRIKQAERQKELRESIKKMEEARLHTQISISKDKDFLKRQEMNLFNVRPGKKEIEIKSSIRAKISDMEAKIRSKEQRVRELDNKIRET